MLNGTKWQGTTYYPPFGAVPAALARNPLCKSRASRKQACNEPTCGFLLPAICGGGEQCALSTRVGNLWWQVQSNTYHMGDFKEDFLWRLVNGSFLLDTSQWRQVHYWQLSYQAIFPPELWISTSWFCWGVFKYREQVLRGLFILKFSKSICHFCFTPQLSSTSC